MNIFLQSVSIPTDQAIKIGSTWASKAKDLLFDYGPNILGAIVVYLIGQWIINRVVALLRRSIAHKKFDASLSGFLLSLLKVTLLLVLFLSIAGILGINIMGFSAILAGAAVGIGAALNGSLGNLAGGVMLMIFRPFKVGDIIEAQGSAGVVKELGIFSTVILTPENKTVILPNGPLSTGVITNFNTHGNLRVDINMAIANDQDVDKARMIALAAVKSHPKVMQTPAPEFVVSSVSDFMTKIAVRPYTTQADYWEVYFGVTELVKKAFEANGIAGPTPTHVIINKQA
ncbi:mechanosensitive ion channel protein [Taibaiella sp. KBW10]|uniref:mechanosensitive ion channel family protein n=1 Tax=Taibaiella sp. KBW10 TaxID=2153357 RepID=UPI000F596AB4|nr:mechanosensitive ion channel family protein [Taibaiella sp. KBW10]RQO31462.1 mechanosensitive ion channel protein [Taibaiella sp. KBW10]